MVSCQDDTRIIISTTHISNGDNIMGVGHVFNAVADNDGFSPNAWKNPATFPLFFFFFYSLYCMFLGDTYHAIVPASV